MQNFRRHAGKTHVSLQMPKVPQISQIVHKVTRSLPGGIVYPACPGSESFRLGGDANQQPDAVLGLSGLRGAEAQVGSSKDPIPVGPSPNLSRLLESGAGAGAGQSSILNLYEVLGEWNLQRAEASRSPLPVCISELSSHAREDESIKQACYPMSPSRFVVRVRLMLCSSGIPSARSFATNSVLFGCDA